MNKHTIARTIALLILCGFFFGTGAVVAAAPPGSTTSGLTALGNGGEIFEVRAGSLAQLFPGEDHADPDRSVMVLDLTVAGESTRRYIVPTTSGQEVESSPRLLYSKESGSLNIVWNSRLAGEASVLLARFEGYEFAATSSGGPVEEIFFSHEGVVPRISMTGDELHLDLEDGTSIDAERQILHLVWPQDFEGQFVLGYSPVIFLNGRYIGVRETLSLPHVDPGPGELGSEILAPTFQVTVADADLDRIVLTFGSSASGRVTSYDIMVMPMEIVHFGELISDLVLDTGKFDPADVASFADTLGAHMIGIGRQRHLRSPGMLTPSMIDFIADGTTRWILDNGGAYDASELADLARDAAQNAVTLAGSLFSSTPHNAVSEPKNVPGPSSSDALVIDVGDVDPGESAAAPAHVLELRFAYEMALPDSGESEITLFTSEDGQRFLASWTDPENTDLIRYVESIFDGTWSAERELEVGGGLSLEQAHALLAQRVR